MLRYLPLILWLGLLVFSLVDIAQAPERRIRALRRPVWVLLVVLLPIAGAVAWLVLGRPGRDGGRRPGARGVGPDDDPEFLDSLARRIARGTDPEGGSPA